jgi:hypothetical protein
MLHVCSGSKTEVAVGSGQFRFALDTGHWSIHMVCPFWANSGH